MKNSIYNKREVPSVHPGCSMAETGAGDYDDFDNPLKSLEIIPEGKEIPFVRNVKKYVSDGEYHEDVHYTLPSEIKNPSQVRDEPVVTVVLPSGVHPFTYLKENGVNIAKAWVFLSKDVVNVLRKLPCRYYQKTVAYGEFFRFENFDEITLQNVEYFTDWKVIREWKISNEEFCRNDTPECIIEVIMQQ